MRYIDADSTIRAICGTKCGCERDECGYEIPCQQVQMIEATPTADVVEVVRCKDCKWYVATKRKCKLDEILIAENDYCSYGERSEDEQIY